MERNHPSRDIIGSYGKRLAEKSIALCISGSVAAVRAPEIARFLMRNGAEVVAVMSPAACRIIHPDLMHWATGVKPITELTGAVEHVALAGNVERKVDLVLVAPATANTIGKAAAAIDDTPVTTVITTAFGEGIPLIFVPAMHEPMYRHPLVAENIARLTRLGARFVMPRIEEGKAKIASEAEIFEAVDSVIAERRQPRDRLRGKRFLITAGRTVEYLDPVRVITNNSSGKMGFAVAEAAASEGAEVLLVCGKTSVRAPTGIPIVETETSDQMAEAIQASLTAKDFDVLVAAAAVGDWKPERAAREKVSTHSHKTIEVKLVPTTKIIDSVKKRHPNVFLVAFRALAGMPSDELIEDAHRRLLAADADLIAVNDIAAPGAGFETDTNEIYIVDRSKSIEHVPLTTKRGVALRLVDAIARRIMS